MCDLSRLLALASTVTLWATVAGPAHPGLAVVGHSPTLSRCPARVARVGVNPMSHPCSGQRRGWPADHLHVHATLPPLHARVSRHGSSMRAAPTTLTPFSLSK
jgi:hypothetical protein